MIRYITGNATQPEGPGKRVIIHVANNRRAWGAGFVLALSQRWEAPEKAYRTAPELRLGDCQIVEVEPGLFVANMVAQDGFPSASRRCALDYEALAVCLEIVAIFAVQLGAEIVMPRIGCGIAGGSWELVSEVVERELCARGLLVTVYDLPGQP